MRRLLSLLVGLLLAWPAAALAHPDRSAETFSSMFERGRLGVMVIGLTDDLRAHFGAPLDRGMLVAKVMPSSPAAKAGVQVGDVITEVAGRAVADATDVWSALSSAKSGEKVGIAIVRDHKPLTLTAQLGKGAGDISLEMLRALPWLPPWVWPDPTG